MLIADATHWALQQSSRQTKYAKAWLRTNSVVSSDLRVLKAETAKARRRPTVDRSDTQAIATRTETPVRSEDDAYAKSSEEEEGAISSNQ